MLTKENRIFELSATYLEFVIFTQTMAPAAFDDEEMTTFRENTWLQNGVFWVNSCSVLQTNVMVRKKQNFCLSWPNLTADLETSGRSWNIRSDFKCRENDDVAFKFDFAAQLAFLPDVTSLFVGWSSYKKCVKRRRVFFPAPESDGIKG